MLQFFYSVESYHEDVSEVSSDVTSHSNLDIVNTPCDVINLANERNNRNICPAEAMFRNDVLVNSNSSRAFEHLSIVIMKTLSEERTQLVFEKLCKFIGENLKLLLDRPDGKYCFREQKDRVYYVSENVLKLAGNISADNLISIGTCIGKFTKSGKFHLHVTALNYLAPYAHHKIWVKPSAEQQFLYGHNVLKSGLGRITESTGKHQGVVVFSMNDVPLGFGLSVRSTAECKHADPLAVVCLRQADIGEYIRSEDALI